MNRSFLIIFIPALLVAAMYLSLGIYPPRRVAIGVALFAAGFGAYRLRAMMQRGRAERPMPPAAPPNAAEPSPPASRP